MRRIIKNTILNYIQDVFEIENNVNPLRIRKINNSVKKGNYIVYLIERELRIKDNFALNFALEKSKKLNLNLKIIYPKKQYLSKLKQNFVDKMVFEEKILFQKNKLDFEIVDEDIFEYFKKIKPKILIIDFNPILNRKKFKKLPFEVYEIDGHNIVPVWFASNKQEYSAGSFRIKIYRNIFQFLTEFKNITNEKNEAELVLEDFIKNKLDYYEKYRNDPTKSMTSGLSKYLNYGFISSQRIALEIIKSKAQKANKEAFLEELIIRKELADNFCFYSKNFKNFSSVPNWAKDTLDKHKYDYKEFIYSLETFKNASTHDVLWNTIQKQLLNKGVISSYLRMYWAKKIFEWSKSADEALKTAIFLNDTYSLDSPNSSGYVGILWSIAGLHDRAFRESLIYGKIRKMTFNSIKKKFDIQKYIELYD